MTIARMRISSKAEYACLALIELAQNNLGATPKRIREIAEAQGIPQQYLTQIMLRLKAAGLVQSARGSVGGYQLVRNPSEISVGEVIATLDGRGDSLRKGESIAARNLSELLSRAQAAEEAILTSVTIAQLAGQAEPHNCIS
jgi:Rrf2 family transcriptional regulator, cysteine metabolism repressor